MFEVQSADSVHQMTTSAQHWGKALTDVMHILAEVANWLLAQLCFALDELTKLTSIVFVRFHSNKYQQKSDGL